MITLSTLSQPEYKIDEVTADPRNMRVRIAARSDGIIAAILSLLGIKGTAHITANPDGCSFERGSFSGTSRTFVPWSHASATVHSTNRALGYLGIAFPLAIFGLTLFIGRDKQPTVGLILLGLAALVSVLAFLKQSVLVGVLTTGGTVESLKLKGGAAVMEELTAAMHVIESLCRGADAGDHGGVAPSLHPSSTSAGPPAAKSGDTSVATCPHCQARMKVPAGREGHALPQVLRDVHHLKPRRHRDIGPKDTRRKNGAGANLPRFTAAAHRGVTSMGRSPSQSGWSR